MTTLALIDSVKTEAYRLLSIITQRDCSNEVCKGSTSPHRSFYCILPDQVRLRYSELCGGNQTERIE